jgi:NitT/TauT family transport system permease protein
MKALNRLKLFTQGFIMINILWYLFASTLNLRVLPKPTQIYVNLDKVFTSDLGLHIIVSLYRIIASIGVSLVIGLILGVVMAYSKTWNKILNPLVYFSYPVPKAALLPVVMLLFGLGDASKIIVIVLIVVFQVIIAMKDAILNIPQENYSLLKSLGASKYQLFRHITLPGILPELITNLRLALGTSLSVLFFIESYGTQYGIGYFILYAWTRIDYISMYGGIIVISIIGFILFILVDLLEEFLCKWKVEDSTF